jgi:MFS family permease
MQLTGTWLVFAIATALACLAAALCLRLRLAAPAVSADEDARSWRQAIAGLGALWGEWGAIALLLVMATRFVIGGALDILGISFSEDVLGRGASGAGLIIGAMGIGGLLGALIAGSFSARRRLTPVISVGGLLQGLGLAAVALVTLLVPAMLMLVVCGIGGSLLMVAGRTLLQRTTDDRVLARVFAVQEGTGLLGWAFGSAIAPVVIAWLGPAGAFVPFGIGCALFTIAALLLTRRLDRRAVLHPMELGLLRRVPFLTLLPPYELERLASHASWIDVLPGDRVIEQGDVGDAFYVIADGEFSVTVDGAQKAGSLGPGTGFGEIALLHAVPRTATVTAVTAGRVLAIGSEQFLAAVTDSADGHAVAVEVADAHLQRPRD